MEKKVYRNINGKACWIMVQNLEAPNKEWEKAVSIRCIAENGALKGCGNIIFCEPLLPEIRKMLALGVFEMEIEDLFKEIKDIYQKSPYNKDYICARYINKVSRSNLTADIICDYFGSYLDAEKAHDDSCGYGGGHHMCVDYGISLFQIWNWCEKILILKNKYKELKEVWKINL